MLKSSVSFMSRPVNKLVAENNEKNRRATINLTVCYI